MIRYDTLVLYVLKTSKADESQLNLPSGTKGKKIQKLKTKTDMLRRRGSHRVRGICLGREKMAKAICWCMCYPTI